MSLMTYEQIQERLRRNGVRARVVSKATGIGEVALSRLKRGHVNQPKYETLRKLTDYFEAQDEIEALRKQAEARRRLAEAIAQENDNA